MGNPSINRRRILLGLAAASTAVVTVGATVATAATTEAQASPKLLALAATFKAAWAEFVAAGGAHSDAEQALIDARPKRPERMPYPAEMTERFRCMTLRDIGDETHPVNIEHRAIDAENNAVFAAYDAEVQAIEKRHGWKKVDGAYLRLMHRACRAADRILYFPTASLADLAIKARVHKAYTFDDRAIDVFARDIERLARRAARS